MTIYKSVKDEKQNIILPSGHFCRYQLIPGTLSNTVELVVLRTNIPELIEMYKLGKCYRRNKPEDSILLEGTKVIFS
ncbi:UNVERIFIED_CONTAM: hypothetical protein DVV56_11490 [Lactobacillus acidophilus]|nr:hypothetical protein [Lactobacillus acidophilus]